MADQSGVNPAGSGDPLLRTARAIRRWLIAAVALLAVLLAVMLTATAVGSWAVLTWQSDNNSSASDTPPQPDPAGIPPIVDAIKGAYGDALESVTVTQVALTYDGAVSYRPYAVTYRLTGFDVPIEGLVDSYSDLSAYGLTPTAGPLGKSLTDEQFAAMRTQWTARSSMPMGFTFNMASDFTAWTEGDEIRYGGRTYHAEDLWAVSEGWLPTQAETPEGSLPSIDDVIFHLDPKTGQFSYVATKPSQVSPYPAYSDGGGN